MSAPLRQSLTAHAVPQPLPAEAPRPRPGAALADDLRRIAGAAMAGVLHRLFEAAITDLQRPAATRNARLRALRLQTAARLGEQRGEMQRVFEYALTRANGIVNRHCAPAWDELPAERRCLAPSQLAAEAQALANVEAAIDQAWGERSAALAWRLDALARDCAVPFWPRTFTAASFARALRLMAERLDGHFDARALLYRLFSEHALPRLGEVYAQVEALLDGRRLPEIARGALAADATMAQALQRISTTALLPADARLAAELSASGGSLGRAYAPGQRVALVGFLFRELQQDPLLPAVFRLPLEQLRYPALKAALTDSTFFTAMHHPVRALLDEVAAMAMATCLRGDSALADAASLVEQVLAHLEISAGHVQSVAREMPALSEPEVRFYLETVRAEAQRRRELLQRRARTMVTEEIEHAALAHRLPARTRALVHAGWAPLMASRLLRHGIESPSWRSAHGLLTALLGSLARSAALAGSDEQVRLLPRLQLELRTSDLREPLVQQALASLRAAFASVASLSPGRAEPAVAAATAPSPIVQTAVSTPPDAAVATVNLHDRPAADTLTWHQLFAELLSHGQWFRIFDAERAVSRWLKVSNYYPNQGVVTFCEFDGSNPLRLRAQHLQADLASGRSEPINAGRRLSAALKALSLTDMSDFSDKRAGLSRSAVVP